MFVDYYKLLDIEKTATEKEIKKSYRQKSKVYHPDSGGNEKDFILLTQAYETLMNASLRASYDRAHTSYFSHSSSQKNKHSYSNESYQHESKKTNQSQTNNQGYDFEDVHRAQEGSNNKEPRTPKSKKKQMNRWIFWSSAAANAILILSIIYLNSILNSQESLIIILEDEINIIETKQEALEMERDELAANMNAASFYIENELNKLEEGSMEKESKTPVENNSVLPAETENVMTSTPNKNIEQAGYFTVGSSIEEVKKVMGKPPTSLNEYSMSYDFSTVYIEDGIVTGWRDTSNNLKVDIPKTQDSESFSQGDTIQDVINAMGTPTGYEDYSISYDFSTVYIEDGIVTGWRDTSDNLKVR